MRGFRRSVSEHVDHPDDPAEAGGEPALVAWRDGDREQEAAGPVAVVGGVVDAGQRTAAAAQPREYARERVRLAGGAQPQADLDAGCGRWSEREGGGHGGIPPAPP